MDKLTPCLWFLDKSEEAINFYISLFEDSKIISIQRYPDELMIPQWAGMEGKIITAIFELAGQSFMALDGGPHFKFNPTISFSVNCKNQDEVNNLYEKLVDGGKVLMPLQKYPFSELYAWVEDRYGVSWQLSVSETQQKIVPSFMFVGETFGRVQEALDFYTSTFKNPSIDTIAKYEAGEQDEEGKIKYSAFQLEGQQFSAMESSFMHNFKSNGAISFQVECHSQEEVDYYWGKLSEQGDLNAQQCGWLQDKFGFSWQVVPKILGDLLSDPDKEKSDRVMKAMLPMKKIIVADLEAAANSQ